ncbi:hypothetical protein DVH24_014849 [Malus domestica]|uniref:Uncharacterized protein n=1 Tax=Malus domestica TaxID=3750 RepID=A0A498K025_MALDO|nr:hypothetical protein DVH24_014849 [Malus domestica]
MAFVVKDLQPLRAAVRRQPRYHLHLPQRSHVAAALDDVAALDEVFVRLRVVEAPHHRPHGGHGRSDLLSHGGAALVGPHSVRVVPRHGFRAADPPPLWFWYCDDAVFDVAEVAREALCLALLWLPFCVPQDRTSCSRTEVERKYNKNSFREIARSTIFDTPNIGRVHYVPLRFVPSHVP